VWNSSAGQEFGSFCTMLDPAAAAGVMEATSKQNKHFEHLDLLLRVSCFEIQLQVCEAVFGYHEQATFCTDLKNRCGFRSFAQQKIETDTGPSS